MSAAPVAYEVHASRAAAERALLSYSSTLLLARAAGCSVPAMRLQLLRELSSHNTSAEQRAAPQGSS